MSQNNFDFVPATLEEEVVYTLSWMSGFRIPPDEIKPGFSLTRDLKLTSFQREALRDPFLYIAQRRNPSARMTRSQCEKLKTVAEAIKLVKTSAGVSENQEVV